MGKLKDLTNDEILTLAMCVGKLLLENGSGTARVEEKMLKICYLFGIRDVNVFVTPTFIVVGEASRVGGNLMCRIMNRCVNLSVLCVINEFIHNIDNWNMNYTETLEYLKKSPVQLYSIWKLCIFAGVGAGVFSMLLGGTVFDFPAAFATAAFTTLCLKTFGIGSLGGFAENCIAGVLIGLMSTLSCILCKDCNIEKVAVGAIMPFLPGLVFTNGLRDIISGDLLSGNSRISEAITLALSLALGLGSTMFILLQFQKFLRV